MLFFLTSKLFRASSGTLLTVRPLLRGTAWHALRNGDISSTGLDDFASPTLHSLLLTLLSPSPSDRPTTADIRTHPAIARTRRLAGTASVLAAVPNGFLEDVLRAETDSMDLSP